ncbi:uncharacterized protein LOC106674255 isoform X1 [Cimex lectularius]|uniref:Uncharacterized protein n=1 Tax=Cimex lectularius TaxID=79782 RepID=A0A8I6SAY9_CIMLE|nr:uncharacterized protein LOC106674255 isoform X1 [Cimex lectularius]
MDPYQEFLIREMQRLTNRLLACQEEVWRRRTKASLTCPPFQPRAPRPTSYCLPSPANRFYNCNRPGCACNKRSISCLSTQLTPFQSQSMLRNKTVLLPAELTKYEQRIQKNTPKTSYQTESKESDKIILSQRESPFESTNRLMNVQTEPSISPTDSIALHLTAHFPNQNQKYNSLTKYNPASSILTTANHQGTIFQHYMPIETSRLYKTLNMSLGNMKAQQFKNQTASNSTIQQSNKITVMPTHDQYKEQQHNSKLVVLPANIISENKNLWVTNKGDTVTNKVNKMVVMPSQHSMKTLEQEPKEIVGKSKIINHQRAKQNPPSKLPQRSNEAKPRPKSNIATHFVATSPSVPSANLTKTQLSLAPSFLTREMKKHNCLSMPPRVKNITSKTQSSHMRINKESILPNYPTLGTSSNQNYLNQQSRQSQQSKSANSKHSIRMSNKDQNFQHNQGTITNFSSDNIYKSSQQMMDLPKPRPKSYHGPKKQPVNTKQRPMTNVASNQGRVRPKSHAINSMQTVVHEDSRKIKTATSNKTVMKIPSSKKIASSQKVITYIS